MLDYLDEEDREKLLSMGYRIIRKLGEGSFSKVYLASYLSARDKSVVEKKDFPKDQPVRLAVKLIDKRNLPENLVSYLDSEIHLLSYLSHPHIIHVHSILRRDNLYMIFMRHAEYGSLSNFLQAYGAVKEKFARIWIRQIALAIIFLHALEIAHRGIKCDNIFVTFNSNVKLGDLGFARFIDDEHNRPLLCTTFCGSLPYAAPEILQGNEPYDGKSADIWSLGVVLFVMLNRCFPFKSENIADLWSNQVKGNYKFLPEVNAVVSPDVVTVTELLLQPVPKERLSLDNLVKSKWVAEDPSLVEMTTLEKLAMKRLDKVREYLRPDKEFMQPEEPIFVQDDDFYANLIEEGLSENLLEDKLNRGTYMAKRQSTLIEYDE